MAKPTPAPLKHLHSFVREVSGRNGLRVVQAIGDGATDETIQKKTNLKIAQIRATLNHLHSFGLVEYSREKNLNSGWFTYTWRVNLHRAMQNFLAVKKREYEAGLAQLANGDGAQIYSCRKGCDAIPFEAAFESQFKCPRCEGALKTVDGAEEKKKLNSKVAALEELLSRQNDFLSYAASRVPPEAPAVKPVLAPKVASTLKLK